MPTVNDSATRAKYDWPSPEVFAARLLLHDHLFIASPTDDELVPARVPPQPVPVPRRQRKRSLATVLAAARKAGANHVTVDGAVIALSPAAAAPESDANEWDTVLPEGDHGPH